MPRGVVATAPTVSGVSSAAGTAAGLDLAAFAVAFFVAASESATAALAVADPAPSNEAVFGRAKFKGESNDRNVVAAVVVVVVVGPANLAESSIAMTSIDCENSGDVSIRCDSGPAGVLWQRQERIKKPGSKKM